MKNIKLTTASRRLFALSLGMALFVSSFSLAAVQVIPKGDDVTPPQSMELTEEDLKQLFSESVQDYRNILRKHWPDAEISNKTRLVSYSDDLQQKRVIDFAGNELQITMASVRRDKLLDYRQMQASLYDSIKTLLSTDLETAIKQDPINRDMAEALDTNLTSELGAMGKDLILSELFQEERPDIKAIERMARKLTKDAYIRYPAVASLEVSFTLQDRTTYIVPLPDKRIQVKAKRYKPFIFEFAQSYNLPPALIFAIVHAESSFNPLARSQVPAFGLMQIVPHSAGKDASKLIYNQIKILSPNYLYNPQKNVRIGAAYFHLLYYRYLNEIEDSNARMYCAIAAYNAGLSSVMRTLTGSASINDAPKRINRMSANEVLRTLVRQMPSAETREYLSKILKLQKTYAQI